MDLDAIKVANENPAAFRKSRDEVTARNEVWNRREDRGNYWPGKYGSEATAYKPVHGGYPSGEPAEQIREENLKAVNPVPGSEWASDAIVMQKMQEELSATLHRKSDWTIADELRRKPEGIEFDAVALSTHLLDRMAQFSIAYAKLSTALHIHRNLARFGEAAQHEMAHADLQKAMLAADKLLV